MQLEKPDSELTPEDLPLLTALIEICATYIDVDIRHLLEYLMQCKPSKDWPAA